jgi:tetratricopeptide (TPR) repeat protein
MRKDLQKNVILSLGIFLFLFLASCGSLRKEQMQREMGYVDKQAQLDVEAGEFQKAIDLYREIYQKYPQDPTVRSNTIKTLESIKVSGDRAFERSHFEMAGNIYEILAKNWSHFADLSLSLSFDKNLLGKKIKTSRCLFIEQQVLSYLKAGEFQKAIDICNEIYRKHPQDPMVRSNTIKTLESIKISGDRAFEGGDFALAGWVYEILLKHVSSVTHLIGSSSFDREGLTAKIKTCKKTLFENGLEQYRSGNLDQAISIWKSILAFDPENQEIKKVVDMATLQLRNLQKAK